MRVEYFRQAKIQLRQGEKSAIQQGKKAIRQLKNWRFGNWEMRLATFSLP
jgi:hypothetical protein